MFTHIVFFRLKDQSATSMTATKEKLLSMNGRIPQLRGLEVGVDVIRSERSYDVALITRFDSREDMQAYQIHPYHEGEILPYMKGVSASVAAIDYES